MRVSEVIQETGPGPHDQIRACVPGQTKPRCEIVLFRMPQGCTERSQLSRSQVTQTRDRHWQSTVGRCGRRIPRRLVPLRRKDKVGELYETFEYPFILDQR